VVSPAVVRLAYCFSQISHTGTPGRDSGILDLKIYVDKKKLRERFISFQTIVC
jgi:hypothetical protein